MEPIDDSKVTGHRRSLTQIAHDHVRTVVQSGDVVIDATAGNGHDTLFLMELVGSRGTVYSFDIQQVAIERTRKRVYDFYSLSDNPQERPEIIAVCGNHSVMSELIRQEHQRQIACVMFNLGYLPSGDKSVITSLASTKQAITQAASLLSPNGCLSILAYTGHHGGKEEAEAVASLLAELCGEERGVLIRVPEIDIPGSPVLFFVRLKSS